MNVLLIDLMMKTGKVQTKSNARRVIMQGGVCINGLLCEDMKTTVDMHPGCVLTVGKRKFKVNDDLDLEEA